MNKFYRFSPIKNETELQKVWEYIADQLHLLAKEVLHEDLSVTYLKVFAHYPEEYKFIYNHLSKLGEPAPFNSDTSFYVEVNQEIKGNHIKFFGVRIVDPYRMQVGCGDYEVDDFQAYREKHIGTSSFIRDIKDSADMLEIWHPDFDVLGYVIPKE